MTLDEEILAEAREMRGRLLELQRDAERAQADYHHAIRRLQAGGGSLREIAVELGLSHQRVHQIVGADAPAERPRRSHRRPLSLRFTPPARAVVAKAQDEARALGHERVGTEHLLLGARLVESGGAARVLAAAGIDTDRVRAAVASVQGGGGASRRRRSAFTPAAKRAFESALAEAARLKARWIGSEHVLLGLLATEGGGALELISQLGADPVALRDSTLELLEPR